MKPFLFLFYFLIFAFFIVPQVVFAETEFTVSNMDFNSTTGAFSFNYDAGGITLNHQITLRLPYDASYFNYDVNEGDFTCTSAHCSGIYSGDKATFTCAGVDYRVMSTVNSTEQYTSNSLSAADFSRECSTAPTPTSTPTPTVSPTPTPLPEPANKNQCKKEGSQKFNKLRSKHKGKVVNYIEKKGLLDEFGKESSKYGKGSN